MKLLRRLVSGEERPVYAYEPVDAFAEIDPGEMLVIKQDGWPEMTVENDRAGALLKVGAAQLRVRVDVDGRVHVFGRTDQRPPGI